MTTLAILVEDCKVIDVHDGDTFTVEIALPNLPVFERTIRPIEWWSEELKYAKGKAAADFARELLLYRHVTLKVPYEFGKSHKLFSFERLLADTLDCQVWTPEAQNLATLMIAAGHATKTKPKKTRAKK